MKAAVRWLRRASLRAPWALPTLLGAILRLHGIGDHPLWTDEGCSVWFARWPLARLWDALPGQQQHPPLYFALLHLWRECGDTEAHLRLLSALCSIAGIPLAYALGRVLAGRRPAVLAAFLLALAPFSVRHAQEARMYPLFALEAGIALWGCARLLHGVRGAAPWLAYGIGSTAALYTHNLGFLVPLSANAACLWLRAFRPDPVPSGLARRWIAAQVALLAAWGPWLPGLFEQGTRVYRRYWIPAPTVARITDGLLELHGGIPASGLHGSPELLPWAVAAGGAAAAVLLALLGVWKGRRDPRRSALLGAALLLPPAAELLASLLRPVLLPRTLLWTGVPAAVAGGWALARLRSRAIRPLLAALILGHVFALAWWRHRSEPEPWDWAARHVAARSCAGDAILFVSPIGQAPFDYYFARVGIPLAEDGAPEGMAEGGSREPEMTPAGVRRTADLLRRHGRVWLVMRYRQYVDPQDLTVRTLAAMGRCLDRAHRGRLEVRLYQREP